jgi:predicted RNA polymerase sigma factor
MTYTILIHETPDDFGARTAGKRKDAYWGAYAVTGQTDWEAIALLYEGLAPIAPTIGARVAHAGALAEARDAYARAIGLSEDAAVREFLAGQTPP